MRIVCFSKNWERCLKICDVVCCSCDWRFKGLYSHKGTWCTLITAFVLIKSNTVVNNDDKDTDETR